MSHEKPDFWFLYDSDSSKITIDTFTDDAMRIFNKKVEKQDEVTWTKISPEVGCLYFHGEKQELKRVSKMLWVAEEPRKDFVKALNDYASLNLAEGYIKEKTGIEIYFHQDIDMIVILDDDVQPELKSGDSVDYLDAVRSVTKRFSNQDW